MQIITSPWDNLFFDLVKSSRRSIKITSPFVKNNIVSKLLAQKPASCKIELITSFKLTSVYKGALDLGALEAIIESKGIVKNCSTLHAKIYLFDDEKAVVSSGNLTTGGLIKNYEYGVYSDEKGFTGKVKDDFNSLFSNENTGNIKKDTILSVKKILDKLPKHIPAEFDGEDGLGALTADPVTISSGLSGWKKDVFNSISLIDGLDFSLKDIYLFEGHLQKIHPQNKNIKEKIRQQLQHLRDVGLIEFLGDGKYRKLWAAR